MEEQIRDRGTKELISHIFYYICEIQENITFLEKNIVTASVSSVRHASNTGELAHANLNTLIFYSATRFISSPCHSFTNQDRVRSSCVEMSHI